MVVLSPTKLPFGEQQNIQNPSFPPGKKLFVVTPADSSTKCTYCRTYVPAMYCRYRTYRNVVMLQYLRFLQTIVHTENQFIRRCQDLVMQVVPL